VTCLRVPDLHTAVISKAHPACSPPPAPGLRIAEDLPRQNTAGRVGGRHRGRGGMACWHPRVSSKSSREKASGCSRRPKGTRPVRPWQA